MKTYLIVDLDDTVWNWIIPTVKAYDALVKEMSLLYKVSNFSARNVLKAWNSIYQQTDYTFYNIKSSGAKNEYLKCAFYKEFYQHFKVNEGFEELFKTLEAKGVLIVAYSNSSLEHIEDRLRVSGLRKYFHKIFFAGGKTESMYGDLEKGCYKPNPNFLLKRVCKDIIVRDDRLNEVVYLGNSLSDDIYPSNVIGLDSVYYKEDPVNEDVYKSLLSVSHFSKKDLAWSSRLAIQAKPDYILEGSAIKLLSMFEWGMFNTTHPVF